MGLSDDQRALLRLLAQREQGYDDIAALMGLSVEEVRARVKDALDAVEREGGEAPPLPPVPKQPEAPAEPKVEKAPEPRKPAPPVAPKVPDSPPPAPKATKGPRGGSLPKERRVLAIAGGLGVVVVVIVLLATGAIGGGSDSGSSTGSGGDTGQNVNSTENALGNEKLSGAVLKAVDGGDARGAALFGKAKKQVLLQVEATGLDPSPKGDSYTIWLYKSPQRALRIGAVTVPKDSIRTQLPMPMQLLPYVNAGVFDQISISLTSDAAYKAEVAAAKKQKRLPPYAGTEVLRGPIEGPISEPVKGKGGS